MPSNNPWFVRWLGLPCWRRAMPASKTVLLITTWLHTKLNTTEDRRTEKGAILFKTWYFIHQEKMCKMLLLVAKYT
jgi:hypothetical protein